MNASDTQERNAECDGESSSSVHTQNSGISQRISGQRLHERARDPECGADEDAQDRPGHPQPHPEVPSPLTWFVVRSALQTGILDDIADHPAAFIGQIAARLKLSSRSIEALMPTLIHHGMVAVHDDAYRLDSAGEALLADEHEREEFDGHEADLMLALAELAPALREGASAWTRARGATLAADAAADADRFDELEHAAEVLRFVAGALVRDELWAKAATVLITGPGSAEIADLATEAGIVAAFRVTGDWASALSSSSENLREDDGAAADLAIAAVALGYRTDAESRQLLNELRVRAATLVIVDAARADSLNPSAHETPVLALAGNGTGLRDAVAVAALADSAGWSFERTIPLGWGMEATVLSAS